MALSGDHHGKPLELQAPILPVVIEQHPRRAAERTRGSVVEELRLPTVEPFGLNATTTAVSVL